MASTYHLKPLDASIQQIKLFKLSRASRAQTQDADLHVTLSVWDLTNCPPFIALSYRWGSTKASRPVWINGRSHNIGRNLLDFLETYASLDSYKFREVFAKAAISSGSVDATSLYLWVDQLCIDQSSIYERNHQVRLMGKIFSSAASVVVWLGKNDHASAAAIDYIRNNQEAEEQALAATNVRWIPNQPARAVPGNTKQSMALENLARNPYWNRLWVIQEFVVARYITVMCSSAYIHWPQLRDYSVMRQGFVEKDAMTRIINYRNAWSYPRLRGLMDTLVYFCDHLCKDPRDKVYGLLGLVATYAEYGSDTPEVDYSRSVEEVFADTVRCVIRSEVKRESLLELQAQRLPQPLYRNLDILNQQMGLIVATRKSRDHHNETAFRAWIERIWRQECSEHLRIVNRQRQDRVKRYLESLDESQG